MTIHETILKALECYRGDDLYRAKMAYRNATAEEMDSTPLGCGLTPRQLLASYQQHADRVDAAVAYVRELMKEHQ